MSDFEIDFSCIDKLQKKVSEMGKKSNKLTNKALNAGADVILDEMVKRCPVRTGKAKKNLKNLILISLIIFILLLNLKKKNLMKKNYLKLKKMLIFSLMLSIIVY